MNDQRIFTARTIRVEARKRVPATTGHGFTSIHDGYKIVTYNVTVNLRALEIMAEKAAKNRSKKSTDGPLLVEVVSERSL